MMSENQLKVLFKRRSVRVYAPGDINERDVKTMLEAAMAAPSAMTKDPWRFVTIRKTETLKALAAALPGGGMLSAAAMAIAVCGDLDAAFERNPGYLVQDCSAATENLLIAAAGLGLGACWVGVYPADECMRKVRAILRLPANFMPVAVISLGQPGEALEARTRYNAAHVREENW
jgi:nitroreductase